MLEGGDEQHRIDTSQPSDTETARHTGYRRHPSNVSSLALRCTSSPSDTIDPSSPAEESPPTTICRKRSASVIDLDDKSTDETSAYTRAGSGDSDTAQICICQPDPKIPRPRNAFILYRQHHQASVVSKNPGLANPDISKIIGEQWRNSSPDIKNEWKVLAEEEKYRHQQQYPTYRYQPKRNGRRNSVADTPVSATSEKPHCSKCGGRTILTPSILNAQASPSSIHSPLATPAHPQTPGFATTPIGRTLPILRDLSLYSPPVQHPGDRHFFDKMSSNNSNNLEERDETGPLSPYAKRFRSGNEHPTSVHRILPPRYNSIPAGAVVPGTPFPFGAPPYATHPYPPAQVTAITERRESLPELRGMISPPGSMPPPPRPGVGYQQHRLSQGVVMHDRSLTLPPLQTGNKAIGPAKTLQIKSQEETIMDLRFSYKLKVLRKISPPSSINKNTPRGPLIAIEGDDTEAASQLARWLHEALSKDDELSVALLNQPDVNARSVSEDAMVAYHELSATWLRKSREIRALLVGKHSTSSVSATIDAEIEPTRPRQNSRIIDENYNDSDNSSNSDVESNVKSRSLQSKSSSTSLTAQTLDKMDIGSTANTNTKQLAIIPNFSLHASNVFACRIPIMDPYSPNDHWQWCATQWRGIIGPDLTIYVRDAVTDVGVGEETSRAVEQSEAEGLFVVKRSKVEGKEKPEMEGATLRRLGFEISEWVREHGSAH